jgi:hypothetical protein
MKILISLYLLLTLTASCKKTVEISPVKCYKCQVLARDATTWHTENVCTNRIDTVQFHDQNGNSLQSICTEK